MPEPCVGCPEPKPPTVQHAVRFRVWYVGGQVCDGDASSWGALPDDGVLAVKVLFSDGTSRNCSGNNNYGLLIVSPDRWTVIHNDATAEENARRYPTTLWKTGQWVTEDDMQAVHAAMMGDL